MVLPVKAISGDGGLDDSVAKAKAFVSQLSTAELLRLTVGGLAQNGCGGVVSVSLKTLRQVALNRSSCSPLSLKAIPRLCVPTPTANDTLADYIRLTVDSVAYV